MDNWQPTNELRLFVRQERELAGVSMPNEIEAYRTIERMVLQQKWLQRINTCHVEEWLDVPTVYEN